MLPFIGSTEGRDVLLRNDAVHNSSCTRQDENAVSCVGTGTNADASVLFEISFSNFYNSPSTILPLPPPPPQQ